MDCGCGHAAAAAAAGAAADAGLRHIQAGLRPDRGTCAYVCTHEPAQAPRHTHAYKMQQVLSCVVVCVFKVQVKPAAH